MNSTHETLLFHTTVRWLSKDNVVKCVFKMKDEIKLLIFLNFKNKSKFFHFEDNLWIASLAYRALKNLIDVWWYRM